MRHYPDIDRFRQLANQFQLVPVYRRLVSDSLTPVSAFHALDSGQSACLFESVIGGEKVGRYSFLACDPFLQLTAKGRTVTFTSQEGRTEILSDDPLQELRNRLIGLRAAHLPGLPPFTGGAVGYAGYDVVRYTEHLPNAPFDDRGLPDLCFAFYDRMIVFDNVSKTMTVVVMARVDSDQQDVDQAYRAAQDRVDETVNRLSKPNPCTGVGFLAH